MTENKFKMATQIYVAFDEIKHSAILKALNDIKSIDELKDVFKKYDWYITGELLNKIEAEIAKPTAEISKKLTMVIAEQKELKEAAMIHEDEVKERIYANQKTSRRARDK